MPLDAARDLSVLDLLHVLKEKLKPESARLQKRRLSPAEVESEVSNTLVSMNVATGSDGQRFNPPAQNP